MPITLQTDLFGVQIDLWLKLAALLGTAFAWLWAKHRRPRLEAFFTHSVTHQLQTPNGLVGINSHSLVVRNTGSKPAINLRITHPNFPQDTNIQVVPQLPYTANPYPPNGHELVFDRLRPRHQLFVSYLYGASFPMNQFHTFIRFDDGAAHFFKIQHVRTLPQWARITSYYLLTAGLAFTIYLALKVFLVLFIIA